MSSIETPDVIKLLREFGQRVALRGGNPYRAKAYARAAESLGTLTSPLAEVIRQDRLREIPGVGEAIADIITRLHQTGTHPGLEAMRKEISAGALEMLSVPGLDLTHWGVEMARKGGVPADRVLNALTLQRLMQHLKRRKGNQA